MAIKHGMTQRTATILYILVKRAPAVVSRLSLHSIFYGHQADGGPDPKIFDIHISRIRAILKRIGCKGKIETVWHAGYRANPDRSEEHTSELQSLMRISYAVFCLKKKNKQQNRL